MLQVWLFTTGITCGLVILCCLSLQGSINRAKEAILAKINESQEAGSDAGDA